ncbi:MAG: hypothetical protein K0R55_1895 [Sporomusa sp.]|jgi:hypothetical protein|nr:hypothetical protein [Sporomusa sp.]
MKGKIVARIQNDAPVIAWELRSDSGFIRKKHMQAMSAAQELLSRVDTYDMTIYDSLNCGKLSRLIDYIKNSHSSERTI